MKITYYGHSCFVLESNGFVMVLDPYDPTVPGYPRLKLKANAVHPSHGHQDHNYVQAVKLVGSAVPNPFKITEIPIPHDDKGGALRGMNKISIIEAEGKKVIHMGDTGCMPTPEQLSMLKGADVIMIPVGGYFTIDAAQAKEIITWCQPKIAIPMHFRKGKYGYDLIADIADCKLGQEFKELEYEESLTI